MGGCCVRDEDYQSAKSLESLRILVDKDIIYFSKQQKAIMSETDVLYQVNPRIKKIKTNLKKSN